MMKSTRILLALLAVSALAALGYATASKPQAESCCAPGAACCPNGPCCS
jgi:hypothetical protein